MKSSMMALAVGAALAGCSTGDSNMFAARDKTVEYYRVFDIKTDPGNPAVVRAASDGISRHVADATLVTPPNAGEVQAQPGRFKLASATSSAPGIAAGQTPNCEGAIWTAKGAPRVNGGDNMNVVACLFPYKNGYHLDMYAVFTKKEGGWLEWPRRFSGRLMGTPETWTDQTMVDVVRSIRDATGAQVALVEAKPGLNGMPWLEPTSGVTTGPAGAAPGGSSGSPAAGASASTGGATTSSVPDPAAGTGSGGGTAPASGKTAGATGGATSGDTGGTTSGATAGATSGAASGATSGATSGTAPAETTASASTPTSSGTNGSAGKAGLK